MKEIKKISVITAYDYTSAVIINNSSIDWILVGDSGANTMCGYESTADATEEMMEMFLKSVRKGAPDKFIIADIPLESLDKNVLEISQKFMQYGADAVKIEGVAGKKEEIIKNLNNKKIPVMGHLGLTPQTIKISKGNVVQARDGKSAKKLLQDAKKLEQLGCFSIVLECIPAKLAREVSESLEIPTIGIGAGPYCGGQVLVFQDVLGLNDNNFKFVKKYLNAQELILKALNQFDEDIKDKKFPQDKNSFK